MTKVSVFVPNNFKVFGINRNEGVQTTCQRKFPREKEPATYIRYTVYSLNFLSSY